MNYLAFAVMSYLLTAVVYAGTEDKWVYVGSSNSFDGIALLLAIGAFAWVYVIYKDARQKKRRK